MSVADMDEGTRSWLPGAFVDRESARFRSIPRPQLVHCNSLGGEATRKACREGVSFVVHPCLFSPGCSPIALSLSHRTPAIGSSQRQPSSSPSPVRSASAPCQLRAGS